MIVFEWNTFDLCLVLLFLFRFFFTKGMVLCIVYRDSLESLSSLFSVSLDGVELQSYDTQNTFLLSIVKMPPPSFFIHFAFLFLFLSLLQICLHLFISISYHIYYQLVFFICFVSLLVCLSESVFYPFWKRFNYMFNFYFYYSKNFYLNEYVV